MTDDKTKEKVVWKKMETKVAIVDSFDDIPREGGIGGICLTPRPLPKDDCVGYCKSSMAGLDSKKVYCNACIRSALEYAEEKVWEKIIDCDETGDIVEPDDVVNIYRKAFAAVLKKEGEG